MATPEKVSMEVKQYLREYGISQAAIAEKFNITNAAVSMMLNGKKYFGRTAAMQWHNEFGFSVAFLMSGEGNLISEQPMLEGAEPVETAEAAGVLGGTAQSQNYSIDRIIEIMDRNSKTMLSQQETIADLMNELKKRM